MVTIDILLKNGHSIIVSLKEEDFELLKVLKKSGSVFSNDNLVIDTKEIAVIQTVNSIDWGS